MIKSINVFHIIWNWFSVIIVGLKVDGKVFFKSIKFTPSANFNNATAGKLTIKESNFIPPKAFSNTESNLLGKLLQIQPIGKRMNESTFKTKVSCMYETILLKFMNWRRHVA